MDKVGTARLLKLIGFMANLPKEARKHFAMKAWVMHNGDWANVIGKHGIKSPGDVNQQTLIECGMSACALGWGCTMPAFKKAGLKLSKRDRGFLSDSVVLEPIYKGRRDLDAAEHFFRINGFEAEQLFGPNNEDKTPQAWAKRAAKWLKARS